jgi:hypothetical protein
MKDFSLVIKIFRFLGWSILCIRAAMSKKINGLGRGKAYELVFQFFFKSLKSKLFGTFNGTITSGLKSFTN